VLEGLDADAASQQWASALESGARILVGVEGETYVGFAAMAIMGKTVELGPVLVEPRWGRRGHGSRLLAAATDIARQDGADHGLIWIPEADSVSSAFFTSAGWGPDGRVRTLDTGDGLVREICLQTAFPAL
jgi:GNAT superfamily N-acetyltransferase